MIITAEINATCAFHYILPKRKLFLHTQLEGRAGGSWAVRKEVRAREEKSRLTPN